MGIGDLAGTATFSGGATEQQTAASSRSGSGTVTGKDPVGGRLSLGEHLLQNPEHLSHRLRLERPRRLTSRSVSTVRRWSSATTADRR